MSSLRRQRLAELRAGILEGERASRDLLFRLLYGLPAEMQIALASYMAARFLPIYRVHHPNVDWPRELLQDVGRYVSVHGKGLPEGPDEERGGDASFRYCLFGLSDAWLYARGNDLAKLTAACCTTLISAIAARADNVWYADDPEAAHAFEIGDRETWTGRTPHTNVASQAVRTREWLLVADWLEQHGIDHPDTEDEERERVLEWWKDRECSL